MTIFVESLKRLYKNDNSLLGKIKELLNNEKITQDEYDYIVNKLFNEKSQM